jgi:bifunctional UDP-N-acetylglucosamine pyrophosphorylase/glucosamine-1-phosphate N-acetyltransferase
MSQLARNIGKSTHPNHTVNKAHNPEVEIEALDCGYDQREKRLPLTHFHIWLYLVVATSKMPILQEKISTIILAAGVGKRMHSKTPKILHHILGKPIVGFVLKLARDIRSEQIILVVNNQKHDTYRSLGTDICYAIQEEPLGSGDAALRGIKAATCDAVLILCGDVPLLKVQTIANALDYHEEEKADLTILTCNMKNPYGYGRIIRGRNGYINAIIEQTDATYSQQNITEINTGVYYGCKDLLLSALAQITNKNEQGEFYLTDAVRNIASGGKKVCGYTIEDETEIIGINTKAQLAQVRTLVKRDWFEQLMQRGVYIEDPSTTSIDLSVKIGEDVHIRPHTLIEGDTTIPAGATVGPFVWIKDGKRIEGPTS